MQTVPGELNLGSEIQSSANPLRRRAVQAPAAHADHAWSASGASISGAFPRSLERLTPLRRRAVQAPAVHVWSVSGASIVGALPRALERLNPLRRRAVQAPAVDADNLWSISAAR